MEEFFKDSFENTIQNIQNKMKSKNNPHADLETEGIKFNAEEEQEDKKFDMWED